MLLSQSKDFNILICQIPLVLPHDFLVNLGFWFTSFSNELFTGYLINISKGNWWRKLNPRHGTISDSEFLEVFTFYKNILYKNSLERARHLFIKF